MCLWGALILCIFFISLLFTILEWPNGHGMLCKLVPSLCAIFFVVLGIYVFLFGALKSLAEKGVQAAKHLQKIEGTACIFIGLLLGGIVMRSIHIPGGSQIVMLSCFTLAYLSAFAGVCISSIIRKQNQSK